MQQSAYCRLATHLFCHLRNGFRPGILCKGPHWDHRYGGVISPEKSVARGQVSLDEAAERLTEAVELARRYSTARIVFAGGNADSFPGPSEADFAGIFLESLGVARDRIAVETQSRSTAENAVFSKRLIAPKPGERWLLITSAMHMPRAIGAFRQAGFPVEAYPVDYQTGGWEDLWVFSGSLMGGIGRTDTAVHEWLGLFAYRITGRIPVLFPGPPTMRSENGIAGLIGTVNDSHPGRSAE